MLQTCRRNPTFRHLLNSRHLPPRSHVVRHSSLPRSLRSRRTIIPRLLASRGCRMSESRIFRPTPGREDHPIRLTDPTSCALCRRNAPSKCNSKPPHSLLFCLRGRERRFIRSPHDYTSHSKHRSKHRDPRRRIHSPRSAATLHLCTSHFWLIRHVDMGRLSTDQYVIISHSPCSHSS